jgi:4-diphosphocytidyl-2-C-methyl-D-erythritol kinase
MKIRSYAKVNLTLDITGKRSDGYHDVSMIMQEISLYDTVTVEHSDEISVSCNIPYIPCDERNLAHKAAVEFFNYTNKKGGAKIHLQKIVPSGAGLGGGSSNGAAVVNALDNLYHTNLSDRDKMNICEKLGSDVPFFIYGGTCLAEGRGEILTKLSPIPRCYILLAKPPFPISTKWVYQNYNQEEVTNRPDTAAAIKALENQDLLTLTENMSNVLETPVCKEYGKIEIYKKEMKRYGALTSIMTGSGSTVFGVFDSYGRAAHCMRKMKKIADFVFLCSIN